ncbi:hypothetical protein [Amnibacterium setariae]|uniref:Transcriptional regulator, AbiEi antitoxin, Type IV TA system n=1 Tax=Amnibacterium setariae TaxID=2306585 RepID=A0A3A1U658_9MICO|nr:hypothetical protein [Amnibacterium setariae]RIX30937.1 hypothetical protein D1781_06010 [Amnibacterium setariae]
MAITGLDQLVLFRDSDQRALGDRALQRAVRAGEQTRLRSGAYVPTRVWDGLRAEERRRLEAAAMAAMHPAFVASHRSAGALWHLPSVLAPDGLVHARVSAAAGSRTEHGVRKHAVHDVDQHLVVLDGITATSLERTALDLAATQPFHEAVVAMDAALARGVSKEQMRQVLDEWSPKQHRARIERVIAFADPLSGSAGESWSRVQIVQAGLPAPVLQQRFFDGRGFVGETDFWWPGCNLIGEFDGLKKYREAELLDGRTPGRVVEAEKLREDRLRRTATRPSVERWIWATLLVRGGLAAQLHAAGLR